jgi:hypothetical protein
MKFAHTAVLTALLALGLACGYSSKSTPSMPGVIPNIATLSPSSAPAGSTMVGLTVTGTQFNSNALIKWNGTTLATTFGGATTLTATIPDPDLASPGTATVTVVNPGTANGIYGGGTLDEPSNPMTFTIN